MTGGSSAARVAVVSCPGAAYGETPILAAGAPMFEMVERAFACLGLDAGRRGAPEWNPLGDLISKGDRVIIKPNLVSSKNLHERIVGKKLLASSTPGALLFAVLTYVCRAAGPGGVVRVVDSPVEGCELDRVAGPLGIFEVVEAFRARGHDVAFIDLRTFRMRPCFALDDRRALGRSWNVGALVREQLPGDPLGYRTIDLGERSAFADRSAPPGTALCFHRSHYRTPVSHHTGGRHEYSIPKTVLAADVVINLPKMKTHKKTGVTLALKSVIGLTNQKYWLPHFTAGHPGIGGDEFDVPPSIGQQIEDKLSRFPLPFGASAVLRAPKIGAPPKVIDGSWEGNRTLWRTILDLNRILLCADREGQLHAEPVRRYLALVDGIVAGEGEGPLGAAPVDAGLLVAGSAPATVDSAAVTMMGFDPARIPMIEQARRDPVFGPSPEIARDGPAPTHRFRPPRSWPSLRADTR